MTYPEVEFSHEADAAYIAFREIHPGESAEQKILEDTFGNTFAIVDLSTTGEVLGMEILEARRRIPGLLPAGCQTLPQRGTEISPKSARLHDE